MSEKQKQKKIKNKMNKNGIIRRENEIQFKPNLGEKEPTEPQKKKKEKKAS